MNHNSNAKIYHTRYTADVGDVIVRYVRVELKVVRLTLDERTRRTCLLQSLRPYVYKIQSCAFELACKTRGLSYIYKKSKFAYRINEKTDFEMGQQWIF